MHTVFLFLPVYRMQPLPHSSVIVILHLFPQPYCSVTICNSFSKGRSKSIGSSVLTVTNCPSEKSFPKGCVCGLYKPPITLELKHTFNAICASFNLAATQGLLQTVLHGRFALHAIHPMLLLHLPVQMTHLHVRLNAAHYPSLCCKIGAKTKVRIY